MVSFQSMSICEDSLWASKMQSLLVAMESGELHSDTDHSLSPHMVIVGC